MENHDIWQAALAKIELNLSRPNFLTWFQQTGIQDIASGTATVFVPNGFAKEWLQNKYHKAILHAMREITPEIKEVNYVIARPENPLVVAPIRNHQQTKKRSAAATEPGEEGITPVLSDLSVNSETNLNPRYVFDNFVVGSFNELAYAAAQSVIKNPGTSYNPLFIYGGVGLGKTHLIQAIGNELLKNNPAIKIKYVPAEKYMIEIVEALKNQEINKLKEKYRSTDVLIIDDIQFIARTEKMQEEFFHTFNSLYEKNKQIIISSDRPPQAIPTLEQRLRSRFEGGMIADIGLPDFETRLIILNTKMETKKIVLSEDALKYIAENVKNNIRELEGALNRVVLAGKVSSAPLGIEAVKKIISGHLAAPKKFVSAKKIIKVVADFYEVSEKDMVSRSRRKDIVKPRQIAMYLIREGLKSSYPALGEKFGGRDHTTAIHSCEKVEQDLKTNSEFSEEIQAIKDKVFS